MLPTVNIFFNIFIDGVLPKNTALWDQTLLQISSRIRRQTSQAKKKNKNKRMETKGKYENRELLLIYTKIKTLSKERLQILKNRELMVNPFPCSKVGQFPW